MEKTTGGQDDKSEGQRVELISGVWMASSTSLTPVEDDASSCSYSIQPSSSCANTERPRCVVSFLPAMAVLGSLLHDVSSLLRHLLRSLQRAGAILTRFVSLGFFLPLSLSLLCVLARMELSASGLQSVVQRMEHLMGTVVRQEEKRESKKEEQEEGVWKRQRKNENGKGT
eukprot:GHVS01072353.1.p1 GENE.GHVS01072353.1~~GHVS01072353.1.p1  ORF type:complete len:171 (-),score=43.78 GHVS01072353.1:715-1227(-)